MSQSVTFFMHIMKTAGTSFAQYLEANLPREEVYPDADRGPRHEDQYWKIKELLAVPEERRARYRFVHGHFPFVVGTMVGADTTITILRDPVERTISHLRHCERQFERHRGKPLEAVYEDDWHHPTLFLNYQVKQFAMTLDDDPKGHIDVVEIDEARYQLALENLQRVDILGFTEEYDEFTARVSERYGWHITPGHRLQVSPPGPPVPESLRRRIEHDSAADVAFYREARALRAGSRVS